MSINKLKKGDQVVIHTCGEAEEAPGKLWTVSCDQYTYGEGKYVKDLVLLDGYSGSFNTKFLQKVNIHNISTKKIEKYKNSLHLKIFMLSEDMAGLNNEGKEWLDMKIKYDAYAEIWNELKAIVEEGDTEV